MAERRFKAVCLDLLTALIDSWSLWTSVAGGEEDGRRWRQASLRLVTASGAYRPYERIVAVAAREAGLPVTLAGDLLSRWHTLEPYPDVEPALRTLAGLGVPIVVVTNTSQKLAEVAAARIPVVWTAVVSAEAAGYYKPDRRAYHAGALAAGHPAGEVLFVAGSAHDVTGAAAAGHAVYWANRSQLPVPEGAEPLAVERSLDRLLETVEASA